jgi:hypothetical protein
MIIAATPGANPSALYLEPGIGAPGRAETGIHLGEGVLNPC